MKRIAVATLSLMLMAAGARAEEPAATPAASPQPAPAAATPDASPTIQDKMKVGMEYTLTANGKVVDSSEGKGPFHYVHGRSQIIPGLERQLTGLHVGDAREITVSPEEGYGAVDQTAFMEVPKSQLPQNSAPTVGAVLRGVDGSGRMFQAIVSEIKADSVVLNLNHPLAGKTLTFNVKITDIAPAAP